MAELARGTIADRPWGRTLGTLGTKGLTGQLTLAADGKRYCVAFDGGAVVAATSPLINDSAVRVALTGHLISSTQVAEITRRFAQQPDRDEIAILAEYAKLTPDQAQKLQRRVTAQRAARTFTVEAGEFVVEDTVSIRVPPGGEIDVRAVLYLGARTMSEDRLASELAKFGGFFRIRPEAHDDLPQFGFGDAERPIVARLASGSSLVDLETAPSELSSHGVHAVVYALVSCNACDAGPAPIARPQTRPPAVARTQTPTATPVVSARTHTMRQTPPEGYSVADVAQVRRSSTIPPPEPVMSRTHTPRAVTASDSSGGIPRAESSRPISSTRATSEGGNGMASSESSPGMRAASPANAVLVSRTKTPVTPRPRPPTNPPARKAELAAKETEALINERVTALDAGADHYKLLGVSAKASVDEIRNSYFTLARKLHPDRLASLGIADGTRNAQRLFAQINTAFGVLSNQTTRSEYDALLSRGGEEAVKAEEAKVEDMTTRVMRAEEAYRRGEMALRRDQLGQAVLEFQQALELQPNEADYQALLAWAKFAAAPDKQAVAQATRGMLSKAIEASTNSVTPRFYLGRVERMLGREKEALNHFQQVLMVKPHHAEAASEARILEQRLKGKR